MVSVWILVAGFFNSLSKFSCRFLSTKVIIPLTMAEKNQLDWRQVNRVRYFKSTHFH